MTETEFHQNLSGAEILMRLSEDPSFLEGYCRGLRRFYYGEFFCTPEEHQQWLALAAAAADEQSRAKGEGYLQGLSGAAITDIIAKLTV